MSVSPAILNACATQLSAFHREAAAAARRAVVMAEMYTSGGKKAEATADYRDSLIMLPRKSALAGRSLLGSSGLSDQQKKIKTEE